MPGLKEISVKVAHFGPRLSRKYPDSADGAIRMLKHESTLDVRDAMARPDPSVQGVWLVTLKSDQKVIMYLAGYLDPFGRKRENNDFEVVD